MRQNLPQTGSIKEIEMDSVDRSGARRVLQGKLYARAEQQAAKQSNVTIAVRFEAPRDLSGAAYLVRQTASSGDDQIYMFLPAMQRVRRMNTTAASGSLLGTSFSYNDFRQLLSAFDSSDAKLEGTADLSGRAALVVAVKSTGASSYDLVRSWVDRQTCVPMKAEFLSGTKVLKRFHASADALRQSDHYWYLTESIIQDLSEGTATTLRIGKVISGATIPAAYFQPNSFYLPN
jgi:hypothetical protein